MPCPWMGEACGIEFSNGTGQDCGLRRILIAQVDVFDRRRKDSEVSSGIGRVNTASVASYRHSLRHTAARAHKPRLSFFSCIEFLSS